MSTRPSSASPTASRASAPRRAGKARRLFSSSRSERGQAAVEFALVVPVLCLLVLALVDFAKALNYWLDVNHLANEGVRQAAVLGPSAEPSPSLAGWIQQQAQSSELRNGTGSVSSPAQVCISFLTNPATGTSGQVGDPIKVTVSAPYKWIPFVGGATFTIRAESTMRLERPANPALNGECS